MTPLSLLGYWTASVFPGNQFDHVSRYNTRADRERAQHTGNFSFGATGARVGLPLGVLRVGSAVAAIAFGNFDKNFQRDERRDQYMVIKGYQYYNFRLSCQIEFG